jgi:hypothetical protein
MIDIKHVVTVGVDDDTRDMYESYIDEIHGRLPVSPEHSKAALKALMNLLISLEENKTIARSYDSLPSFFITHRMLYMKLYDYLSDQKLTGEQIDGFLFNGQPAPLKSVPDFVEFTASQITSVFETLQPYLEADDDVERFSRVINLYRDFLKKHNDAEAMVELVHQFAGFADKIYLAGYKKAQDGWGGKLDLDADVYPIFFKDIIREEFQPYGFSEYVVDFLFDRIKEVGEAETALPDLYEFMQSIRQDAALVSAIQKLDAQLNSEITKTIALIEQQKGESLSKNARIRVIRELTAYENLEGIVYYFFDERRLRHIMTQTGNEGFIRFTLELIRDYKPKTKHLVMYALGKLLLAPESQVKLNEDLMRMVCGNFKLNVEAVYSEAVMGNLPPQYRSRIPDLEIRFFLNRMMTNTTSLEGFEAVQQRFRHYLTKQDDFPLIHEIFIERAAENRHAAALMSFYIAALLMNDLGDVVSDQIIRVLAGRLALTYSFTRRILLFKEVKKLRYEYDGTHGGRETLYYNGFDRQHLAVPDAEKHKPLKDRTFDEQWIILYHYINNRELMYALKLLDEQMLFDYILSKPDHKEELQAARMDLREKVYKIIDDKFLDMLTNEDEQQKRASESRGEFPVAYYGKYEKIRSIIIAQFISSGWDVEVHELRRKGKRPYIRMTQTDLLRSIKNIDAQRILEQYEYKEARENIDIQTLRKQADQRAQMLGFVNRMVGDEVKAQMKLLGLSDEALALLSYASTKLRSSELRVELGVRQLVERLKKDLGQPIPAEPLPLDAVLERCFAGQYGKIDVKVTKKDKEGRPLIDPETGEEAEKTYTIAPEKFPDYLGRAREEVRALDKDSLYRIFYLITLHSIIAETSGSMAFIQEALMTNKYVVAADGLKQQALENQEVLEYARIKMDLFHQLAAYEIQPAYA